PRLLRGCQRSGGISIVDTLTFGPDDRDKVVSPGIKLYNLRSVVDECSIGSHGPIFPTTDRTAGPRSQSPADTTGLRRGTVPLSAWPFLHPPARNHLDPAAGSRPPMHLYVLPLPPGSNLILHCAAGPPVR